MRSRWGDRTWTRASALRHAPTHPSPPYSLKRSRSPEGVTVAGDRAVAGRVAAAAWEAAALRARRASRHPFRRAPAPSPTAPAQARREGVAVGALLRAFHPSPGSLGSRRSRLAAARRGRRSGCGAGRPGAPLPRHGSRGGRGDRARAGGGGPSRGSGGGGGGRGGLRAGGRAPWCGGSALRTARPGSAPAP